MVSYGVTNFGVTCIRPVNWKMLPICCAVVPVYSQLTAGEEIPFRSSVLGFWFSWDGHQEWILMNKLSFQAVRVSSNTPCLVPQQGTHIFHRISHRNQPIAGSVRIEIINLQKSTDRMLKVIDASEIRREHHRLDVFQTLQRMGILLSYQLVFAGLGCQTQSFSPSVRVQPASNFRPPNVQILAKGVGG